MQWVRGRVRIGTRVRVRVTFSVSDKGFRLGFVFTVRARVEISTRVMVRVSV